MGKRSQLTIADILQRKMLAPPGPPDPLGLVMCPGIAPPTAEDLKAEEEFAQQFAKVIEKHGPALQAADRRGNPLDGCPYTGTYCSVPGCGKPQRQTPSGLICDDSHGGADPLPLPVVPLTLHFKILLFPPSSNHCYFNHPRGGRAKTDKATQFERQFVQAVHKYLPEIKTFFTDHDGNKSAYTVIYQAFFPHEEIINKTFSEGKKGSAVSRYKEVDAENRNKLISDSFAKALGITDKFFFSVRVDKMSAHLVGDVPQIHVYIQKTDPAFFGV